MAARFARILISLAGESSLRTPAHFVGELARLYSDQGVRDFYVVDEQFTLNEPRVLEICDLIGRMGLKITWTVNSRDRLCDA